MPVPATHRRIHVVLPHDVVIALNLISHVTDTPRSALVEQMITEPVRRLRQVFDSNPSVSSWGKPTPEELESMASDLDSMLSDVQSGASSAKRKLRKEARRAR